MDNTREDYMKYRVAKEQAPVTRFQSLFIEHIFADEEILKLMAQPGDLQSIFQSIQSYLKGR